MSEFSIPTAAPPPPDVPGLMERNISEWWLQADVPAASQRCEVEHTCAYTLWWACSGVSLPPCEKSGYEALNLNLLLLYSHHVCLYSVYLILSYSFWFCITFNYLLLLISLLLWTRFNHEKHKKYWKFHHHVYYYSYRHAVRNMV